MLNNVAFYDDDIANKCIYGRDFVKELLGVEFKHENIFYKEKESSMSSRKLQGYIRLAKYRNYYQQNPVRFVRDFFNIQLLDSQAYLFQMSWNKPEVLIVASRAYGKSFWIVLFCMAKQMLSSFALNCYIASGSSQQSATTFKKLEDVANDKIDSLINSTGKIFKDEVEVPNATGDGFSHNPSGFEYHLNNGSFTRTLNSNVDKNRGARASIVFFDETGFLPADLIQVYQAFCANDKNFKTGVSEDGQSFDQARLSSIPKEIPNQKIYVSSASSTDTEFYRMFVEYSKKMILGDPNYFVAVIDCDLVMKPTIGGKKTRPALTQSQIDAQMSTNPEKARREYYCEFTTDVGVNAIIRRGAIARNEEIRKPILYNDTGNRKIIITYDPARQSDNSVILVSEIYQVEIANNVFDTRMRLLNCVDLIDIQKKNKHPMRIPEQVDYLRQLILDYNIGGDENYSNILGIYIDAGAGGNQSSITDLLMQNWIDQKGVEHKGLIDSTYSADYVGNFPMAVDKVKVIQPSKYKSIMFENMIEMINLDKISFTATYDNKGYLTMIKIDEKAKKKVEKEVRQMADANDMSEEEIQKIIDERLSTIDNVKTINERLSWQEEVSLVSIDALKEEVVNIIRIKRENGKDSFELAPEKRNKLHDDRCYTLALASFALYEKRREGLMNNVPKKKRDISDLLASQIKVSSRKIGLFDK